MEEICNASEKISEFKDDLPSVANFLAGKNVFITGGTGFLGTVLIERLLSATPDIGKVYVLIRDKNGHSASSRIERLMSKVVSSHKFCDSSLVQSPDLPLIATTRSGLSTSIFASSLIELKFSSAMSQNSGLIAKKAESYR